jgi:hypothetical protein
VNRLSGNRDDGWKDFMQCAIDAAQELRQIGADGLLRRAQLQGEQPVRCKMIARGAKEFGGVEAVQLRGLRVRKADNDYIEAVACRIEKSAAIGVVQMHAGIKRRRVRGKKITRHAMERGVQLDQVDALDGGMLERLRDAAAGATADEQNSLRRGMLQQRVVNRFFGGAFIRRAGQDEAVFIEAAIVAGCDDRQVAVDRIRRCEQVKAAPLLRLRQPFHARRNFDEKKYCEQRGSS